MRLHLYTIQQTEFRTLGSILIYLVMLDLSSQGWMWHRHLFQGGSLVLSISLYFVMLLVILLHRWSWHALSRRQFRYLDIPNSIYYTFCVSFASAGASKNWCCQSNCVKHVMCIWPPLDLQAISLHNGAPPMLGWNLIDGKHWLRYVYSLWLLCCVAEIFAGQIGRGLIGLTWPGLSRL